MKLNTQSIVADLDRLEVPLDDRAYVLAVAFARAISYKLPIPTSPVDNPYVVFTTQHKADVDAAVAQMNERTVLDVATVTELVCRLWIFRVRLVYDMDNGALRQFFDAMVKSGSRELPPKLSEFLIRYEQSDLLDRLTKFVDASISQEN